MKIGVVSDTHGLLRPEVLPALAGVDQILHLGDVGSPSILKSLGQIAPVHAVRGNIPIAPADRAAVCPKPMFCSSMATTFTCSTIVGRSISIPWPPNSPLSCMDTRTGHSSSDAKACFTSTPALAGRVASICR